MIALFVKVNVRPGKKQRLLDYLRWECQVARDEEPHVLRFDVFDDANDKNTVYYYEAYADEAGFKKHKTYPPFKQWTESIRDECVESTQVTPDGWATALCTTANRCELGMKPLLERVLAKREMLRA